MSADENNTATLDTVAVELHKRAVNMRARNPEADGLSKEAAALQLTMLLIGEMKERRQTIRYTTEYYAQRIWHLLRWSGSNIGGGVMIEYLIDHGGHELNSYLHRLLDQTGYDDDEALPGEMFHAIQRMRKEGRDPIESYKPGDNMQRGIWQCSVEPMFLADEFDPEAWPEMAALVKELEARYPHLRNREMLIEELTTRFIHALKAGNLATLHDHDWYRGHIATLVFHHAHPLFARIISCLLLEQTGSITMSGQDDKHADIGLLDDILTLSDLGTPR